MALVFMDSFDHYSTSNLTEKWPLSQAGSIQAGGGRHGTDSFRALADNQWACRLFPASGTWIVGMSVRWSTNILLNTCPMLEWGDGTTPQGRVAMNNVGQVVLLRGSGTVLATSTVSLGYDTAYYLEWLLTIHHTSGVSTVRVDGIPVVSVSSADTQAAGPATANRLRIGNLQAGAGLENLDIDDLYVCNGLGSPNNTFLGDCRVDYLPPVGDATYRAWTPSSGTDHYGVVDETPPNGDGDYLASSTTGQRDTHLFAPLPSMPNPVVKGVQHLASLRKDDAGTRLVRNLLISSGTEALGPTVHTLAMSYVYSTETHETDPATSAPWTTAAVNAVEAGMENG